MTWELHVRGADLRRPAEVDDYTSLTLIPRFNRTGTWLLDLPARTEAATALAAFDSGLICTRDGQVMMSGPVTGIGRKKDKDGDRLTLSGVDDSVWLHRRLAHPSAPPFTASAYDIRTGAAETVLREYVDANLGSSALPERQVAGLALAADQLRGTTVKGRGRFQYLDDLLRSLALVGGGLGFRIVQSDLNLLFEVYEPEDRTRTAVFSEELGNLAGFSYQAEAAEANHVLAAGGGEGVARTFVEGADSASVVRYGRIETFKDQRQTTDTAELQQAVDEELAERAEQVGLSISPSDTDALQFGRDYNLGDRVTVVLDDTRIVDVLREVKIVLDGNGETVTPTVGTPEGPRPGLVLGLFDQMRRLRTRVSGLERS